MEKIEMLKNGHVQLHRKMVEWEWYTDFKTRGLFIHCFMIANYYDNRHRGILIKRGSFITSIEKLSKETGLSIQSIRTSLKKLVSTNELTNKSTSSFTIITICNYDTYQSSKNETNKQINKQTNKRATNEQQTTNKRLTNEQQQSNKEKEENKEKNNNNNNKKNIKKIINNSAYPEIIEYLNDKTQSNFKAQNTKTLYQILIDNGYTHEDFYTVIDNMAAAWLGTEYSNGLCPGTLFKNPSQFEKWLNWRPDTNNPNNEETFEDDEHYL